MTGCGKDWLIGKWEFDKARTLEAMTAPEDSKTKNLLSGVVTGLHKGLSQLLFTQLDGVTVEYTKKEMRRTKNGVGEAIGYKVIEEADEKTRIIQYDDGTIVTVQQVDNGLKSLMMGEHKVWIYFKPVAE